MDVHAAAGPRYSLTRRSVTPQRGLATDSSFGLARLTGPESSAGGAAVS